METEKYVVWRSPLRRDPYDDGLEGETIAMRTHLKEGSEGVKSMKNESSACRPRVNLLGPPNFSSSAPSPTQLGNFAAALPAVTGSSAKREKV